VGFKKFEAFAKFERFKVLNRLVFYSKFILIDPRFKRQIHHGLCFPPFLAARDFHLTECLKNPWNAFLEKDNN